MSLTGKRRENFQVEAQMFANLPLIPRLWMKFWKFVYSVVAIATYVAMLVATGFTVYWSLWNFDWKRAIIAGLLTVLLVHINKSNPS